MSIRKEIIIPLIDLSGDMQIEDNRRRWDFVEQYPYAVCNIWVDYDPRLLRVSFMTRDEYEDIPPHLAELKVRVIESKKLLLFLGLLKSY